MARYHVNPRTGDPGKCRATTGPCPFGLAEDHFDSPAAAAKAYEAKAAAPRVSLKHLTRETLKVALLEEAELTTSEAARLSEAVELADRLHEGQIRKAVINGRVGTPYVEHPLRNALRLVRMGVQDAEVIEACVLHDVVEDCSKKFCEDNDLAYEDEAAGRERLMEHIGERFSPRTRELVGSVTNPVSPPEKLEKAEKNRRYLAQVTEEINGDPDTYLVKWSDVVDNAGSLHYSRPHEVASAKQRAVKYLPLMPAFLQALEKHSEHYDDSVGAELKKKLVLTELRMEDLLTWDEAH